MNRFKKELKKRGVKLENDYPYMPFDFGNTALEAVIVDAEKCTLSQLTSSMNVIYYYGRDMKVSQQYFD